MRCHTWFYRPITDEEFKLMKEYAPTEDYKYVGDSEDNIESGLYDKFLYERILKSVKEDIPCVYGQYWWRLGWGMGNPELSKISSDGCFTVHNIRGKENLFAEVPEYGDVFIVYGYPRCVIHNRRELRRFMRKKYFDLSEQQFQRISKFFREYPEGVITFG